MIRYLKKIHISLFFILISLNIQAQNQTGSITYKGVVNEKFVDSFLTDVKQQDIPMAIKQRMIATLNDAKPEEFILNFENDESYYYQNPTLDDQEEYNMGSRAGLTPYYTNNSTHQIIEVNQYLGNIGHEPIDWEVTNKTKEIGNYTCRQAKTTEKLYSRKGNYYYKNVIAWFTPEIPLSFGPKYYKGLPGLILQIEDKEFTLTAIKINLNTSEDVKIKKPDKNDKVITQQESYNRIRKSEADRKKSMSNNG